MVVITCNSQGGWSVAAVSQTSAERLISAQEGGPSLVVALQAVVNILISAGIGTQVPEEPAEQIEDNRAHPKRRSARPRREGPPPHSPE